MIRGALRHLPGLGPERLRRLADRGIDDWLRLRERLDEARVGGGARDRLTAAIDRCEEAVQQDDIGFLTRTFHPADHWRILGRYFDRAAWFDIETSGMDLDSHITLIACDHRDTVHTFLHGENLDGFLDLLEEVDLLVSFNGSSFDVPRVLQQFHIPALPAPHIDLRWACYHQRLTGGLKQIERRLDIGRPSDLDGVDGADAVWLWQLWAERRHPEARDRLVRYCCADAIALRLLAARLLADRSCPVPCPSPDAAWTRLDRLPPVPIPHPTPENDGQPGTGPSRAEERLARHWQKLRARR